MVADRFGNCLRRRLEIGKFVTGEKFVIRIAREQLSFATNKHHTAAGYSLASDFSRCMIAVVPSQFDWRQASIAGGELIMDRQTQGAGFRMYFGTFRFARYWVA